MKVQRNISSALILIFAFVAVAYSATYFDKDEYLLLVKLFNRMQAREQGMTRSASLPSYSSPPYSPFLPGRKASQQRKPSTGSTFISPREAWLQAKAPQLFLSRLLDSVQDAKTMKYRHGSKQYRSYKVEMATTVEGRVQDYIKTLNQTKINEQAQKLVYDLFTCSIESLPDFVESLKGKKIFGIPTSHLLEGFKKLRDRSTSGLDFYQGFINFVFPFINPQSLVAKEQFFNFNKLRDIVKDVFPEFATVPQQENESDLFRNVLNVASTFVLMITRKLTAKEETRFNNSIDYFIERYGFKQIDSMDKSEEDKIAMKKALRGAVNTVIGAIFKMRNGERLNSDNRSSLLRSIIIVLASLNNGLSDTPLLQFIDQFLARNPTNKELSTKSQCLLVLFIRKSLDYVLHVLQSDRKSVEEWGPALCAVDLTIDGYRMILDYIPMKVSNAGGCEDFAAIGYTKE